LGLISILISIFAFELDFERLYLSEGFDLREPPTGITEQGSRGMPAGGCLLEIHANAYNFE
jgi:hypothetical protein